MDTLFKNNGIKNYELSWRNDVLETIKNIKTEVSNIDSDTDLLVSINEILDLINDKLPQLGSAEIAGSIPVNIANGQIVNVDIDSKDKLRDLYGRLQVSNPVTLFDNKLISNINDVLIWNDVEVSGGGTSSTFGTNIASQVLAVSNLTAGVRVRQTYKVIPYIPGKGQMIIMSGILENPAVGIKKYIGYMNDNNGLFFSVNSTTINVGIRTFTSGVAVDTEVPQNEWNLDTMDGNGPSGIIIDWTTINIFMINFQWLGVGTIVWGLDVDNDTYYVHRINTPNVNTIPFIQCPNLPMRYEIQNDGTGGVASLTQIATCVISQGGIDNPGIIRSIIRAGGFTTASTTSFYPIIAFRLKSTELNSYINIKKVSIICTTTAGYLWKLILNPTVTGTAFSYTSITNSAIEADIATTNATTVSGGTLDLDAGYIIQTTDTGEINFYPNMFNIGVANDGTSDVLCLAISLLVAAAETFYATITYFEQV